MVLSEKGKYERMNKEKQKSVSCNGIFGFSLEKVKRSERVYKPTMFSFFFLLSDSFFLVSKSPLHTLTPTYC